MEKWSVINLQKGHKKGGYKYFMRPLCKTCGESPCGINYYKGKKTFYRSQCDTCSRGGKRKKPRWYQAGYRKKDHCEKCGFKSKSPEQFNVFHVDGDLNNCRPANMKTVCANCQRVLAKEGVLWRQGDLIADY